MTERMPAGVAPTLVPCLACLPRLPKSLPATKSRRFSTLSCACAWWQPADRPPPPRPRSLHQINEEAELHNRLLDDLDEAVGGTSSRLAAAQRRLKLVMRRSGSCKTMVLLFLVAVVLVVVAVVGFKIAIHL